MMANGSATASDPYADPSMSVNPNEAVAIDAINKAAAKYGISPDYLYRTARIESGGQFDPKAGDPKHAQGLFGFEPGTAEGLGLADRTDPYASAEAAAKYALQNKQLLSAALGRDPTDSELYLAHQQGGAGASSLLRNPQSPAIEATKPEYITDNHGNEHQTAQDFIDQQARLYGANARGATASAAGSTLGSSSASDPYADPSMWSKVPAGTTEQQQAQAAPAPPTPVSFTLPNGQQPSGPAMSGPLRDAAFIANQAATGFAGLLDTPGTIGKLLQKGASMLPDWLQKPASMVAMVAMPPGVGPSASDLLHRLGLGSDPMPQLQPQSVGEKYAGAAVRGAAGFPFGPAGMLAGAGAGISDEALSPALSQFGKTLGLSPVMADFVGHLVAGLPGGIAGGGAANALERAGQTAATEGLVSRATAGSLLPPANPAVDPIIAANMEAAKKTGLNVPVAFWKEAGPQPGEVPPGIQKQANLNATQAVSNWLGFNSDRLTQSQAQSNAKRISGIFNDVAAKTQIAGQPADNLLTNLDLLKNGTLDYKYGVSNPATARAKQLIDQIEDEIAANSSGSQFYLPGDAYQRLTNKDSPLFKALHAGDPDMRGAAADVQGALYEALIDSSPPEQIAALRQAKDQWRLSKTLESVTSDSGSGILDPQAVAERIRKEYGGFDNAPGNVGIQAEAMKYITPLNERGGETLAPTGLKAHLSPMVSGVGVGLGLPIVATELGEAIPAAMNHPLLTALGLGGGTAAAAAAKGVSSLRNSYAASGANTQRLLDLILSGKRQTSPYLLGGGSAVSGTGQQ